MSRVIMQTMTHREGEREQGGEEIQESRKN